MDTQERKSDRRSTRHLLCIRDILPLFSNLLKFFFCNFSLALWTKKINICQIGFIRFPNKNYVLQQFTYTYLLQTKWKENSNSCFDTLIHRIGSIKNKFISWSFSVKKNTFNCFEVKCDIIMIPSNSTFSKTEEHEDYFYTLITFHIRLILYD